MLLFFGLEFLRHRGSLACVLSCLVLSSLSACSGDRDSDGPPGDGDGDGDGDGGDGDAVWEGASCEFGDDDQKCGADTSLACTPVPEETSVPCDRDDDCEPNELCFESTDPDASRGECLLITGICLDLGSDGDGDGFGESCTIDGDTCAGTCVAIDDDQAECEEYCRVGAQGGCGESELEGSGVACAFFAYDLSDIDESQGAGDLGVCAHLCDCNSDCPGAQLCLNQPTDGHAGVCAGGLELGETLPCEDNLGGAGGMNGQ